MVNRGERRWVWIFALSVMLLTTLPYLLAYNSQGADWRYTGFLFGVEDGNSYIAKMLSGSSGSWLFRTPYTAYPQQGVLLFILYMLLGKLAAPPGLHEQLVALFHITRFAGGLLAIWATYDFVALFIHEVRWRRWATVLAALGGGFGWLVVFGLGGLWRLGIPLEYYSPEAFGFLSLFGLGHLAIARAFLLWGLRDYLLAHERLWSARAWGRSAFIWLAVLVTQPMTAVIGWAVMAVHLALTGVWQIARGRAGEAVEWNPWKACLYNALRTGVLTAPMVLYVFLAFKLDPTLSTWENQSVLPSPPFVEYLLAFGVLLPLAVWGARHVLREDRWRGLMIAGWVVLFPALAYAPFSSQRRLVEGVWVALSILAVLGLAQISTNRRRWAYGWLALAFPATLFLLLGGTMSAANPGLPLFRPAGEVRAFQYLAETARTGEIVLAQFNTSNALPAWAPVRTLIGLGTESVNDPAVRARVNCFYGPTCTDAERQSLIREFNVTYVFSGPQEQIVENDARLAWNPRSAPYLTLVFEDGDYRIYRYAPGSGD